MIEVTEKTKEMLADLPPYLQDDDHVQHVTDVVSREYERIEGTAVDILDGFFPKNADDKYGQLSMWEEFLGLPAGIPGIPIEMRRAAVLNAIFGDLGSGFAWCNAVTDVLGTTNWKHVELPVTPADILAGRIYTIVVIIPYKVGSPRAGVVKRLLRVFTPAHLALEVTYDTRFIIGWSFDDEIASLIGWSFEDGVPITVPFKPEPELPGIL